MTTGGAAAHASKRGARAARPIDVYKKLPFLRGAAANPEDQQSTASAQQSTEQSFTILDDENNVVRVTRRDVEAGTLATGPKQKRLNIPTPVCGEVEDYAKYARRMTDESLAYVRGIGPRRPQSSTVGRPPASSSGGILGRPPLERREWEFNEPDVANDGRAVAKEYDPADEIEYIISVQDERWLKEELPRLVQRRMGGGAQKCLDSPPPTNAGGGATSGGRKRGGSHKRKVPEELKPANGHGEADFFKEQKTALVSAPAAALVAAPVVAAPVEKVEPWAVAMAAHLTVDVLEALFDALEHACAAEGAAPVAARAADALACTEPPARGGVGARFRGTAADAAALGPLAHHYWMQQRHKLGRALIRRYWPSTAVADTNPHCVFRPREKERYKLRKHRRNDVDAFRKLQLLRRDFAQAHDLVRLVQRRELLKRLRSDAKRGKPRLDLEDLAQRHGLIPLGDEYDFADDAADYGVDVRPKAEGGVKAEPKALAADGSESKADEAMPPAADSITAVLAASAAKGGKNSAEGAESKASRISPSKRDGRAARPDWKSASAALKERLWALVVRTVEPVAELAAPAAAAVRPRTGAPQAGPAGVLALAGDRKPQRQRKKQKRDDGDAPPRAPAEPKAAPAPAAGDGKPCVPQRGFMDQGWWGCSALRAGVAVDGDHDEAVAPWAAALLSPRVVTYAPPPGAPDGEGEAAAEDEAPPPPPERSVRRRTRFCRGNRVAIERYSSYRVQRPAPASRHAPPPQQAVAPPRAAVAYSPRAHPRRWFSDESQRRRKQQPEDEARRRRFERALQHELVDRASSDEFATDDDDDDSDSDSDSDSETGAAVSMDVEAPQRGEDDAAVVSPSAAPLATPTASQEAAAPPQPPPPDAAAPAASYRPPYPMWRTIEDDGSRALYAPLPARRPTLTIDCARIAEIYALSDSEDEDLESLDAPEATAPGATPVAPPTQQQPRIKFAFDI